MNFLKFSILFPSFFFNIFLTFTSIIYKQKVAQKKTANYFK